MSNEPKIGIDLPDMAEIYIRNYRQWNETLTNHFYCDLCNDVMRSPYVYAGYDCSCVWKACEECIYLMSFIHPYCLKCHKPAKLTTESLYLPNYRHVSITKYFKADEIINYIHSAKFFQYQPPLERATSISNIIIGKDSTGINIGDIIGILNDYRKGKSIEDSLIIDWLDKNSDDRTEIRKAKRKLRIDKLMKAAHKSTGIS